MQKAYQAAKRTVSDMKLKQVHLLHFMFAETELNRILYNKSQHWKMTPEMKTIYIG